MRTFSMKRLLFQAGALGGLIVLLSACAGAGANQGLAHTPSVAPPHSGAATARPTVSATPGIGLGSQVCPILIKDPTYWDPIIPTQSGVSQVKSVTCGYLKGISTLQALVTVLYSGTGARLDVYVYDNLNGAAPAQIFKLQNLLMGAAKISGYNTVETAEVDQASSQNVNRNSAAWTPDLFREFKWFDGVGTLEQVAFSGIFPDLTRYQAEADQAQVNQGHQPWKLSPTQTAQAFGASLLQWDPNATATLVSGGGAGDTQAVVSLKNTAKPADNGVTLNLARLEGNTNGGIWIVTDVASTGLSITQPQSGTIIHNTTTVTGTGSAFESVIGPVTVLDHLYTDIGRATAHGATGNGATTFKTTVTAQPTFKNGAQEGLVMLTLTSNANGGVAGAVIVKVLIQE
jgi:hypothetical protein